jgi:phosphatidate cytidylyltransferase
MDPLLDDEPAGAPEEKPQQAEKAKKPGSGRNLPVAIGVGVALGALVLVSLYTVKEIFLVVMAVFLCLGLHELTRSVEVRGIKVPFIPLTAGLLATLGAAYGWHTDGLVGAFSVTALVLIVWRMPAGAEGYVRDVTASVFIAVYLALMGGVVALLLAAPDGDDRIVIFIAVTVSSDIGGFFAGTFLGKHKMAPTISPKKTWEGVSGSALTCMLVGGWLVPWLLDGGEIWQGVIVGAAVVVSATVGDLIESMIKRDLGVKDMGTLLPGHGGVMDRLDSLVATAPIVWLLLEAFVPSN